MEFEAFSSFRPGELRRTDLRAMLGDEMFFSVDQIRALVVGRPGELSSVYVVRLGWSKAGRGEQRMLICDRCSNPSRALLTDGEGGLACARCLKRLTPHQREHRLRDFQHLGGREVDHVVRLLRGGGRATPAALHKAAQLAEQVAMADIIRFNQLLAKASATLYQGAGASR